MTCAEGGWVVPAGAVSLDKVSVGSTELTHMHHRQTALVRTQDGTDLSDLAVRGSDARRSAAAGQSEMAGTHLLAGFVSDIPPVQF
jgi:hypothetical protein